MIFADPPDNIGLGYASYEDKLDDNEYIKLFDKWVNEFVKYADVVWLSFNSKWTLQVGEIVSRCLRHTPGLIFKPCVQTFSFYQHNKKDLGNAHRPLWRLMHSSAVLYPEQIKIPSWRQLNGDKRAKQGGKVPGDSFDFTKLEEKDRRDWHERAIEVSSYIIDPLIPDDNFDFTRVVGNSKQRRKWHPTQLHEGLIKRCVLLSTKPGDRVIDPFGGTGTTLRVCKETERECDLVEIDQLYCNEIASEHKMKLRETGNEFARWELEC